MAAVAALAKLHLAGDLPGWPVVAQVAAVSVGIVGGATLLDLDSPEDQSAEVDVNVVATVDGRLIEVQGTGEGATFPRSTLDAMLDSSLAGIEELCRIQREVLAEPYPGTLPEPVEAEVVKKKFGV